jgi:hypothetical protein
MGGPSFFVPSLSMKLFSGNAGNMDSINTKVFGKGGMGFWEGREKLFFRKVFPPFPNAFVPSNP